MPASLYAKLQYQNKKLNQEAKIKKIGEMSRIPGTVEYWDFYFDKKPYREETTDDFVELANTESFSLKKNLVKPMRIRKWKLEGLEIPKRYTREQLQQDVGQLSDSQTPYIVLIKCRSGQNRRMKITRALPVKSDFLKGKFKANKNQQNLI